MEFSPGDSRARWAVLSRGENKHVVKIAPLPSGCRLLNVIVASSTPARETFLPRQSQLSGLFRRRFVSFNSTPRSSYDEHRPD